MRKVNGFRMHPDEFMNLMGYLETQNFRSSFYGLSGEMFDRSDDSRCGEIGTLVNPPREAVYLEVFPNTRLQRVVEEYADSRESSFRSATDSKPI